MRVLWWGTYSYRANLGADSVYIILRNALREVTWGHHYLVVPTDSSLVDDLDSNPRVTKVRVPMSNIYPYQEALPHEGTIRRFAPNDGPCPVDALVSTSPQVTLRVAHVWGIRTTRTAQPLIVNWDLLVRDDARGEFNAKEIELLQAAAGCYVADMNVFESRVARRMTMETCRLSLSAGRTRRVADSAVDIPQGIPVSRLREAIEGVPKREKFTVYYGGRFSASKRVDELSDVFDTFYRYGRDVDYVVTTGSLANPKRVKFERRFPQAELHVGLSQEEAWRVMASCHASICFSRHELFGMAFWEQMVAGLAVIMKAENWNVSLLPAGYDLTVKDAREAGALLRMLHGFWEDGRLERELELKGWGPWVAEQYDTAKVMPMLLDTLRARLRADRKHWTDWFEGGAARDLKLLAAEVLQEGMTFPEYVEALRKASRSGRRFIGRTEHLSMPISVCTLDAYRMALHLGWEDIGGPEATFSLGLS